jgi:hypothetical protein
LYLLDWREEMFVLKIIFAVMFTIPFGFFGYFLYTNIGAEPNKGQNVEGLSGTESENPTAGLWSDISDHRPSAHGQFDHGPSDHEQSEFGRHWR